MKPLALQPIPYQGSKRSLAPRICSLIRSKPKVVYEPFAGSAAVSLYMAQNDLANQFVIGDSFSELVELWRLIVNRPNELSRRYRVIWEGQFENPLHFNQTRQLYNEQRDPAALLYLIARCVKNAIRFNRRGQFTQSSDNRRKGVHPDKLEQSVIRTSQLLKGRTELFYGDFTECISSASSNDLVYMDPPYQGTTYGRDKRYAFGLERPRLIRQLEQLRARSVPYILSYDGQTGERIYGEPLPASIGAKQLLIHAGRSSQATLAGKNADTIESLYVSELIDTNGSDIFRPATHQGGLFSA